MTKHIGFTKNQRGFNVIEVLIFLAVLVVLGLMVVPNINLFLGIDKKLAAANVEAANMKVAAIAYESNTGKFPSNSDALWSNPSQFTDYVGKPRAYYEFDIGTGRILSATVDTIGHVPENPWTGIRWDFETGSWVK
jgi:competence protein ComGC